MADNYLEKHREEYEKRKELWLKSRKTYKRPSMKKNAKSTYHLTNQVASQSKNDK